MSDERTILVTGAGRGIGAAICRALATPNHRLIATARSANQLEALEQELQSCCNDFLCIPADLTQPDEIARLVKAVRSQAGSLDILINNAGIAWGRALTDTTLEDWRELMALNIDAVFLLTRDLLPLLKESNKGQIISIGSDASIKGIPNMSCYCASKFALRGFTMALRHELAGSGIRVNLVMPGPVNTTIIAKVADRQDLIQPADVAEVVAGLIALPRTADVWEALIEPSL